VPATTPDGPLSGIRVLEVANWLAVPNATALMADLGADVVKVEPPGGEAHRGFQMRTLGYDYDFETNYVFEFDNRGKRSVAVDLRQPGGPELVRRLAASFDIFATNLVPHRRERLGLGFEAIREANPSVVYAAFTGYGETGPDADRPGFDTGAFWARAGVMALLGEPPSAPPLLRSGQGDHTTGLNLLAATLAALRQRDRTGAAQFVEVTLLGTGLWTIASDIQGALLAGHHPPRHDRTAPANPIRNSYPTQDGRWIVLVMTQPDRYWATFCEAIDRPEWAADERYGTLESRGRHREQLAADIEARLREQPLAWWASRLDEFGIIWAPAQELPEVIADPQVQALAMFPEVEHERLGRYRTIGAPFRIAGADVGVRGPAPEPGQHTHEVLRESGLTEEEIADAASRQILG
jgi:crotonobetainyl-CoA:carnitine CoA-transferase CaiB-like acyl-CoA transferase